VTYFLTIAAIIMSPAVLCLALARVRARRREEIAGMSDVPRILHGTSEETMLEYLETAEAASQDRRGALSPAVTSGGDLSLPTGEGLESEDDPSVW
jgi:hypothetical protein